MRPTAGLSDPLTSKDTGIVLGVVFGVLVLIILIIILVILTVLICHKKQKEEAFK